VPTPAASRAPRNSRRWRRHARRYRPADGTEHRRFLWVLGALVGAVLAVVGGLLLRAADGRAAAPEPAAYAPRP